MFEDKGSFSYTLNLPLVKELKQALGYIDKPDKQGLPQMPVQGKLGYQGGNTWPVFCYAKELANKTANLYFRIGLGGFLEATKNQTLQDLTLGGERTIEFDSLTDLQYPDSDYTMFPVKNMNFLDGSTSEAGYKANIMYMNYPSGIDGEMLVPFPFVAYVLEQIFNENGYTVEENIFATNADFKKLCEFNLTSIMKIYQESGNPSVVYDKAYLADHLPELTIADYLDNIKNKYNIGIFINENNLKVKIISNEAIITDPDYTEISDLVSAELKSIVDKKYTAATIKTTHDTSDEYFQAKYKDIDTFLSRIKGTVATVGDLTDIDGAQGGDVYYVIFTRSYYELQVTFESPDIILTWAYLCDYDFLNYNSLFAGDVYDSTDENILEIENELSTLYNVVETDARDGVREWKVPILLQPGNSIWLNDKVENSHRHLMYHGMQEDSEGDDYQFGSFDNMNYNGELIGSLLLNNYGYITTVQGIWYQYWRQYLHWKLKVARTFETWINFPTYMLFNFPWEKKFRVQNTNYFIKQIEVDLRYKGPSIKNVEIVKC